MNFPIYKTKKEGVEEVFDINSPSGRQRYFHAKAGKEIEEIKEYLDNNTFVGFLLAKKSAGKGTYTKMLEEILGSKRLEMISVGDLMRETQQTLKEDDEGKKELVAFLHEHYRGLKHPEQALDDALNATTKAITTPDELILALLKRKIDNMPDKKAIFLDGFPRTADQVNYSLFFREIMDMRNDPDFFVLIDVPDSVIDERMKFRVVCPICQTSRNIKLLPTTIIKYNEEKDSFDLICDNEECKGNGKEIMVRKDGDEKGIENIRGRLKTDGELIELADSLFGIPSIKIRNAIPLEDADGFDDYELTPEFNYKYDKETDTVKTTISPWIIKDNEGVDSNSLMAPAAVLSFINQLHRVLIGTD